MHIQIRKVGSTYCVDVKDVDLRYNGEAYRHVTKAQFAEEPKEIKRLSKARRILRYEADDDASSEGTVIMAPGDFERRRKELLKNAEETDDGLRFPTLEAEYTYKKFWMTHKPVWEDYEKEEEVTFHVVEITGRTDVAGITPFRLIGKEPVRNKDVLYEYVPDPFRLVREIAEKHGFKEIPDNMRVQLKDTKGRKWSASNRPGLEFMKVNGEYVGKAFKKKGFRGVYAGTFDECHTRFRQHYRKIDYVFTRAEQMVALEEVGVNTADMVKFLEDLKEAVGKIDSKVKTADAKASVKKQISDMIRELGIEDEKK